MFKQKAHTFTAWMLRLKHLNRWPLMHSVFKENVASHSHEVTVIAHQIAIIAKENYSKDISPSDIAVAACYHEAGEAKLGDFPSPIKYLNEKLTAEIKKAEHQAEVSMLHSLDENLQECMKKYVIQSELDRYTKDIVKAADIISMALKASNEIHHGNRREYSRAYEKLITALDYYKDTYQEVKDFCDLQMPMCELSLDELTE
ncbi:5'-deoxynucleotidase [Vibrio crassostreae]|uniref:5'-deoxynucleotidase n=1 Tax=Vibrio crassostreae TaxID=246167 RepID=UPI001B31486D|nr:5'-deoxynucleotidase [Vibrio crassostreae]